MSLVPPYFILPPEARSPSPVVPGAWPPTGSPTPGSPSPFRKDRSSTYPPPSRPGSAPPTTPLHLDRVTSFHQRLSLSLSHSSDSHSLCIPFSPSTTSDGVFTPSYSMPGSILSTGDSGLTRFTTHNTSTSLFKSADTSISTAYTADLHPDHVFSLQSHLSQVPHGSCIESTRDSKHETRIYSSNRSVQLPFSSDRSLSLINDFSPSPTRYTSPKHPVETLSSRPERPRIVLPSDLAPTIPSSPGSPGSVTSLTTVPTSPMIFASPASSRRVGPLQRSRSLSNKTSYSAYESLASSISPPSPSTMSRENGFSKAKGRHKSSQSSSELLLEDNIEATRSLTMLTTLSLPGSPRSVTDVDADVRSAPWTHSPISLASTSPASMVSSYGQAQSNREVVSPAPSRFISSIPVLDVSLLSSSPLFAEPSPSPTSDLCSSLCATLDRFSENPPSASAAEYAAAVMSFAWGSDSSNQVASVGETLGAALNGTEDQAIEDDSSCEEHPLGGAPVEYISKGTSTRISVVEKVKRFGGRMKRLLRGSGDKKWKKDLEMGRDIGRRRREGVTVDVDVDVGVPARYSTSASLGISACAPAVQTQCSPEDLNPQPHWRRPCPSLNEHTCLSNAMPTPISSVQLNASSSAPPVCSPDSSSSSPQIDTKGKGKANMQQPGEDPGHTQRFPQTQAQVQANPMQKSRRLSLSAITNLGASSYTQPAPARARPLSSIIVVTRHAPVVDTRARAYRGPVNVEIDGLTPDPVLRMNQGHTTTGGPPGLSVPPSSASMTRLRPEAYEPASADAQAETTKKKNRRLSLSALSNLAGWKESPSISANGNSRGAHERRRSWRNLRGRA